MKYTTILFDGYNTLFDKAFDVLYDTCQAIVDDLQLTMSKEAFLDHWDRYFFPLLKEGDFVTFWDAHAIGLQKTFADLKVEADPDTYVQALFDAFGNVPLFPDVKPALSALSHVQTAVVSNADHGHLTSALSNNNLTFLLVISSETARCYKPNPGIFHDAIKELNADPEKTLYSSIFFDFRGAWGNLELADELKELMAPLYQKHMDDIITGNFSGGMMDDWADDDKKLLTWREATAETAFEKSTAGDVEISEQEYYDNGILMVAMIKAGVELAFETMTDSGIIEESAYYESLHEVPLIANLIGRKKLYEMNKVISDTAEYGCYLFSHECVPLLEDFMKKIDTDVIGKGLELADAGVDNAELIAVNDAIRAHPIEVVGKELRKHMTAMKRAI